MPDDLEQLQRKIEEGLAAVRELKRLEAEKKNQERPKLRLIQGGLIGGAIWAGVDWLRGYRRGVAALTLSGLTMGGVFIAEQPHSPGSDPPDVMKPPASVMPSAKPDVKPAARPTPRPPRTSPLRTLARNTTPVTVPSSTPKRSPTRTVKPPDTPGMTPSAIPTLSLAKTPLLQLPVETPALVTESCTINLLGIKACLPLG